MTNIKIENKFEKTPENISAWFACDCIQHSGFAHNLSITYNSSNFFEDSITKSDLINVILKNKVISSYCLLQCHFKLNNHEKLKLLNNIIDDEQSISMYINNFKTSPTISQLKILVPQIINNFQHLSYNFLRIVEIKNPEYVKKLRLNKETKEKLDAIIITGELLK